MVAINLSKTKGSKEKFLAFVFGFIHDLYKYQNIALKVSGIPESE